MASCLALLVVAGAQSIAQGQNERRFAARRAADDSRPLSRAHLGQADSSVVLGRFKAPIPDQVFKNRIPKSDDFGSQTMSASYRVSEGPLATEKLVHGITGSKGPQTSQQVVGARIQVSDEGLNYPPSKLSADIYGNVAEIVTAPPESVDNDFLLPQSNKIFGERRLN